MGQDSSCGITFLVGDDCSRVSLDTQVSKQVTRARKRKCLVQDDLIIVFPETFYSVMDLVFGNQLPERILKGGANQTHHFVPVELFCNPQPVKGIPEG